MGQGTRRYSTREVSNGKRQLLVAGRGLSEHTICHALKSSHSLLARTSHRLRQVSVQFGKKGMHRRTCSQFSSVLNVLACGDQSVINGLISPLTSSGARQHGGHPRRGLWWQRTFALLREPSHRQPAI